MEYEQNTKRGQYVSGLYSSSRTKRNHATLIEEKVEVAENTYNYDKNVYIYDIELGDDEEIGAKHIANFLRSIFRICKNSPLLNAS